MKKNVSFKTERNCNFFFACVKHENKLFTLATLIVWPNAKITCRPVVFYSILVSQVEYKTLQKKKKKSVLKFKFRQKLWEKKNIGKFQLGNMIQFYRIFMELGGLIFLMSTFLYSNMFKVMYDIIRKISGVFLQFYRRSNICFFPLCRICFLAL